MKKQIILLLLALGGVVSSAQVFNFSQSEIILKVERVKPTSGQGSIPRTPVNVPSVSQDGHSLYFNNVDYDLELVLLDEDGDEAYSVVVPANTASVVLPSSLNGDYELQLYPTDSSYYFYSDITL